MAGVVQSEYRCAFDAWPLVVAAVRSCAFIEEEKADGRGSVCFLKVKQTPADQAGVMLDVIPTQNASTRSALLVAMHWLSKSTGPDKNVSRRLAVKIETILKSNGAECCYSPVDSEEP
jgi:hypothetical protein